MIDFHEVWLPQIIGYAELISGPDLWKVWINKETEITSVIDFGELYEQLIGDLDSDFMLGHCEYEISNNPSLCTALKDFFVKFHEVNKLIEMNNLSSYQLLKSDLWLDLARISKRIILYSRI